MNTKPITKAVELLGGQVATRKVLGVSQGLVSKWCVGRLKVDPKHCIPIEKATAGDVTRYDLRPDIFGTAADALAALKAQK